MKIALISYEYPPDTPYGGIATYIYQVARMLHQRGHHVEVFTASHSRSGTQTENGVIVHRVLETQKTHRVSFSQQIGQLFANRHAVIQFDVLEGAEADAHARGAVELVGDIPLVIKLHTPQVLLQEIGYVKPSLLQKLRWYLGAIRQGKVPQSYPRFKYDFDHDIERIHTLTSDEITTPSQSLGERLIDFWKLPKEKVVYLPNPYIPSQELLNIPTNTHTNVVSFVGRLEVRKGILDLAKAIPYILKQSPNTKFRFIGLPCPSPIYGLNTQQYIEKKLRSYKTSLEFIGVIPLSDIPSFLAKTDICVFPSRWENFPNVCLEAMAAGRGIVGSNAGGMAEMLEGGRVGRLVSPRNHKEIAEAVLDLLDNPELRMQLGAAARQRVLTEYNQERIGALQEASYERAIQRRQVLGKRDRNIKILTSNC